MKAIDNILIFCISALLFSCVDANQVTDEHPELCVVSFIVDNVLIAETEVPYASCVSPLDDDRTEGIEGWFRKIDGWYTEYNFNTPVTADIELHGLSLAETFSVTYHFMKEEVEDYAVRVPVGQSAFILEMKLAGDEIVEWCTDKECTLPYDGSVLTADTELFAKWESALVPDTPDILVLECEDGTLLSGSEVEEHETASEGKAVNIRDKGSLKMVLDIPEDGAYRFSITYLTWSNGDIGASKINKVGVSPDIYSADVDFKAYDVFTDMDLGVLNLKKGRIEITLSYSWGWTVFDKVTFERTVPLTVVEAEFEDGILSDGAYPEEPVSGASSGKAVCLGSSGKVSVTLTVPKAKTYDVIIRYFGWSGQNKVNYIEIPGLLPKQEFTFTGTNGYMELVCGRFGLEAGQEIQVTASSFWGWSYFDKVSLVEVKESPASQVPKLREGR